MAELELAGAEIDRFSGIAPDGRPVRGVRLASRGEEGLPAPGGSGAKPAAGAARAYGGPPGPESASTVPAAARGWGAVRVYRGSLPSALAKRWATLRGRPDEILFTAAESRGSRTRLLAPLALVIGAAVIAALVLGATRRASHPVAVARGNSHATRPAQATVTRPRVHGARAHSNARATRTGASSQSGHVVASDTSPQTAPASSAAAPGSPVVTSSPPAANPATPSANSTAPVASTSSGENQPQAAVQAFYEAGAQHRYAAAWGLADTNMREEVGGFAAFADQMSSVREISFKAVDVLQRGPTWATISVRTTSVQTTATHQCWGTVRTVNQSGAWLLDGISIHCT